VSNSDKPLLDLLTGEPIGRMPIWFMRQAGRYLPEYRELRAKAKDFLTLCLNPEMAAEVTLQPVRRFDIDAAILFSDILVVPYALGQKLEYKDGEGPVLPPIEHAQDLTHLQWNIEKLAPIFETVSKVHGEKEDTITLIGFAGGLWTVACYMLEGHGGGTFARAKEMAERNDPLLHDLMDILLKATLEYLGRQIEAGAEVIQIFDSWAGLLRGETFRRFVIEPTKELVEALKNEYPEVPVIGFPRGASHEDYEAYFAETGITALGLDQHVSLSFAKKNLHPKGILQGNIDPQLLWEGGERMRAAIDEVLAVMGPNHILNLGHGIFPETPPEHVADFIAHARRGQG